MTRHDLRNGTQKSIRPTVATRPGGATAAPTANEIQRANSPAVGVVREPSEQVTAGGPEAAGARRRWRGGGRGGTPNVINAPPDIEPFRLYWNAPFEISPHNPQVVYMASQYFFKSTNRGDTWRMNTKDLTKNVNRWSPEMPIMNVAGDKPMAEKHDGYSSSSLITQVRESPSKPGIIWIGTDDGVLQISKDGGETFTNVYRQHGRRRRAQGLRADHSHRTFAFRSRQPLMSRFDNHRCCDDWKPYLFKTTDYGKTWTQRCGQSARRSSASFRRCARTTTIRTCCSSAPRAVCMSRSTAARNGRSS